MSFQPTNTEALAALGLRVKQSSSPRSAWRQAPPMARASSSRSAIRGSGPSPGILSQPASSRPPARASRRSVAGGAGGCIIGPAGGAIAPWRLPEWSWGQEERKRLPKKPFLLVDRSVPLAAHDAKQGQQALEHVEDVQVQGQRGTDVVGLAAVQHPLEVIQHEGAE